MVFTDQGPSPRLDVVLPSWEDCFMKMSEAEGPGSALGLGAGGTR